MAKNKESEKKDQGPKPRTDIARLENLPDFMRGQAGMGTERIRPEDVEIPRIKLLQALNPEVQEGGQKQGTFFHTVAEQNLGSELKLTIVYVDQSFILWRPRKSGGGILARAMDGVHWSPADAEFDVQLDDGKTKVKWRTAPTVAKSGLSEPLISGVRQLSHDTPTFVPASNGVPKSAASAAFFVLCPKVLRFADQHPSP